MRKNHGESVSRRSSLSLCSALLLLAALVLMAGAASASAQTAIAVGGTATVTNTDGDNIRIREGAGTGFVQVGVAREGQTVTVLAGPRDDKNGKPWYKVEAPAATGWMSALFLKGTGAPAAAKLTGTARVANTDGDPLRMRSAPIAGASVLTLLNPGATVGIVSGPVTDETGIEWYEVRAKGLTGWSMARYLAQAESGASDAQPASQSKPAATPTATAKAAPKATATPEPPPAKASSGGTLAQYRQWVEEARAMYPYKQSTDKMWSVMMCESGGRANASGGGGRWLGLFQYAPGTWRGTWNPYRNESIWDAKSQIFATAKAWSIGMQSHWSCYYITPRPLT